MPGIIDKFKSFIHWWFSGLYQGLPTPLRHLVHIDHPRLILNVGIDENQVNAFWYQDGRSKEVGTFQLNDDFKVSCDALVPHAYRKKRYLIDLRLQQDHVLSLRKPFPDSVTENLYQTVRYQLDRLTPFPPDKVYFDAMVKVRNKKLKRILADIFVAPKSLVDNFLLKLKKKGIPHIDQVTVTGISSEINLLPDESGETHKDHTISKVPLYFLLVTLILSISVPILYKERRIAQLDTAIAELRQDATAQLEIRDKLYEAEDALNFLREKRSMSPMALEIVETLARQIPAHTWLERLELSGNTVEIRGESLKALSLIDLLEDSPAFSNVKFNSPVALNKKNNRDKFHIQATVEVPNG